MQKLIKHVFLFNFRHELLMSLIIIFAYRNRVFSEMMQASPDFFLRIFERVVLQEAMKEILVR